MTNNIKRKVRNLWAWAFVILFLSLLFAAYTK